MKKLFALVLVLVMAMALTVPAMADDVTVIGFAQETGYTFTEYLTMLRISKAQELLKATDLRSSKIAQAVGYTDPHYFSYLFKKRTGLTPSEYRFGEKSVDSQESDE